MAGALSLSGVISQNLRNCEKKAMDDLMFQVDPFDRTVPYREPFGNLADLMRKRGRSKHPIGSSQVTLNLVHDSVP